MSIYNIFDCYYRIIWQYYFNYLLYGIAVKLYNIFDNTNLFIIIRCQYRVYYIILIYVFVIRCQYTVYLSTLLLGHLSCGLDEAADMPHGLHAQVQPIITTPPPHCLAPRPSRCTWPRVAHCTARTAPPHVAPPRPSVPWRQPAAGMAWRGPGEGCLQVACSHRKTQTLLFSYCLRS